MLLPILVTALAAAIVSAILALNSKDGEKVLNATWIAGAIAGFLMFLVIFFGMPAFSHWSAGGPTIGLYIVLLVGGIVGGTFGYNEYTYRRGYSRTRSSGQSNSDNTFLWVCITLLVIIGVGRIFPVQAFNIGIGPNPCSVEQNQAVIRQLLVFDEAESLEDAQESSVEKVSDGRSLQLARNAQPQGLQLGEYLVVQEGFEQVVNGVPVNVHPMGTKDIVSYRRFGSITPGFLLVDSSRTDGYAQWIQLPKGEEIVYLSNDAPWGYNLNRHVYFNYELPNRVKIEDLKGPEITDDYQFWYVGTVMKPSEVGGASYYMPTGIITVNPTDGTITEYTIEEALEELPWLDRILPTDTAKTLVSAHAKYQNGAAVCNFFTDSGQWEIDEDPLITTRDGEQLLQFFATTLNDEDPLIQEIIYVRPRTMVATSFPGNGMLVTSRARELVEKRANPNTKPELYSVTAKEPTHMWFGGQQFMVFVLESGTTFKGFGAIRSDLAKKESDRYVITGDSIEELAQRAIEQNAQIVPGSLDDSNFSETAFELRVEGVVEYVGLTYIDNNETKVLFTVRGPETNGSSTLYTFRADARQFAEKLVAVGHEVTVTGQAISTDPSVPTDVSTIVNHSYPPTPAPTWTPES